MVYNREEVAQRAEAAAGRPNTPGMCQAWTRGIIGVHAVGDVDGDGDADAVDGWKSEPAALRKSDRNPPRGVPVAWSGGSRGFGHRAVSLGNGMIASTDANGTGRVGIVPLSWVEKTWGMTYLGWTPTMSGISIPMPPVARPAYKDVELEVVSWNVFIGSPVKKVREELTKIIDKWNPDVIYLYEASHLFGELDGLGYVVRQLKPRPTKPGHISNNGNIVAMVRNGLKVEKSAVARMKEYWKGPKHGRNQDPRVYRFVKVRKQGVVWKVGGFHLPFGTEARRESVLYIRRFLNVKVPNRPAIALGDMNLNEADTTKKIARPTDSKVAGERIDLAVYKNCDLVREHNLGKRGSDHPAWRYVFKKRRKLKAKKSLVVQLKGSK